jgi:hypothetical protein
LVYDNKMWVMGGRITGDTTKNDVWYSTDGITWTQATAAADWSARAYFGGTVYDNKMWVMGGWTASNTQKNDVWYSTDGATWTQATAAAAWSARHAPSVLTYNNKMWVIGGASESGCGSKSGCVQTYNNSVYYSTDGATWTQATAAANWTARANHTSVVYNNKMWVLGGRAGLAKNDVWYSNLTSSGWVRILGCDAYGCSSPSESSEIISWATNSVQLRVPSVIADNVSTGSIIINQAASGSSLQHTYSGFRILPRITNSNPASGGDGDSVGLFGNHFCQAASCPGSLDANNKVTFYNGVDATSMSNWTDTIATVSVPTGAATGSITLTSATFISNNSATFSVTTVGPASPSNPTSLGQYLNSGLTNALSTGGTASATIYLTMTMTGTASGTTLYPQVEYKPVGTPFDCSGTSVCGSATTGTGVAGPGPIACSDTGNNCAISALPADETYHWQARVKQTKSGADLYSAWVSYPTASPNLESEMDFRIDTTAPSITSGPSAGTPAATSATITWGTSGETSTSQVQYRTVDSFVDNCATNSDCTTLDSNLTLSHSVGLTGLTASTSYYFRVRSMDAAGNEVISSSFNFTSATASSVPVSGIVTSSIFDTGVASGSSYNSIMWRGNLGGAGQDEGKVRFQLSASNSPTGPWTYAGGATCGTSDWWETPANTPVKTKCYTELNNKRYYRYKVQLCSNDCASAGTNSPLVTDVVISWSP